MKKIILIPAYQPNHLLIELMERLKKEDFDIIVVDDGGGPYYQTIFQEIEKDAVVLHHEINLGKGKALKTGYQYIKDHYQGSYSIVSIDCDGQHTMEDAKKLFDYNEAHPEEFVLGSRKLDKGTPIRSKIGNGITRFIFSLVSKTKVYDTQTGLRAFSNSLIDFMLAIPGERFEYEMNVLLELAKHKIPIHEIPIQTIYINHNSGSHFHAVKDSFRIYKQIFKYTFKKK